MKKLIAILFAVTFSLSVAGTANALLLDSVLFANNTTFAGYFNHGNDDSGDVNILDYNGDFLEWTFSFTPLSVAPDSSEVSVSLDVVGDGLMSISLLLVDDGNPFFASVDLLSSSTSEVIGAVNVSGVNWWTTGLLQASFTYSDIGVGPVVTLTEAVLDAAPVPEPATMLLLGSGLIGMFGFNRKKIFRP